MEQYPDLHSIKKRWKILIVLGLIATFGFSIIYYAPYANMLGLQKYNAGLSFLTGSPLTYSGHLWRINQTNYALWVKGHWFNLKTNDNISNFNQCYSIIVTIEQTPNYYITYDLTAIPGDYVQCQNS